MPDRNAVISTDPPQDHCLTPGDRALLNAVFGWHMPGAAFNPPAVQTGGRPALIPLMAWMIADARRHGDVEGEITPGEFSAAAALVNRSPTQALHLSPQQIARGLRHLENVNKNGSMTTLASNFSNCHGASPVHVR
jgi:hypothetical protein